MNYKVLIIIASLFSLISCNSTRATIDEDCIKQNSFSYSEPEDSLYNLPFGIGESYELRQGNCTFHTHSVENKTEFAFDFVMDIGTPIHAARSGKVAAIEDRFFDGNNAEDNYIIIAHEDHTFSYYVHLTNAGVTVDLGEFVKQGDVIGYSGNSGMESIPHLHFHVIKPNEACLQNGVIGICPSIPISFKNASPSDKIMRQGAVYTAL